MASSIRKKQHAVAVLGLLATFAWLGCASAPNAVPKGHGTSAGDDCFDSGNARTFSPLDERFVYVRVLSSEHYLLTIGGLHPNLPFATGITIASTFRHVCADSGAMLTYVTSEGRTSARIVRV